MNKEEYEMARKFAINNRELLSRQLPQKLARKENKIFKRLTLSQDQFIKKLTDLYSLMDEINLYMAKFLPCKKDCSFCCYIKVDISTLEAEYIKRNTIIEHAHTLVDKDLTGKPCPFLTDKSCAIYEYRPFVCRRHHALVKNANWCKPDRCYKYELPQIRFTEIEKSYQYLVMASNSNLVDIRLFFW